MSSTPLLSLSLQLYFSLRLLQTSLFNLLTFTMLYSAPALGPSLPAQVLEKLTEELQYDPLVQPALLRHEIPASPQSQATTASARFTSARILAGQDDRVIVVVGPCSIHSTEQALEYAQLLRAKMSSWPNLHIVMRAYL